MKKRWNVILETGSFDILAGQEIQGFVLISAFVFAAFIGLWLLVLPNWNI